MEAEGTYTAFAGHRRIVTGSLETMLRGTKACLDAGESGALVIFEDATGRPVDFDFRGAVEEVVEREVPAPAPAGRGRPKLGVVSREVSLLPRHWEWLEQAPGGISAALRRLVEEARRHEPGRQRARRVREAASRVMTVLAGDLPGYEEATRALFARSSSFDEHVAGWPTDVREHLGALVAEAARLEAEDAEPTPS